MKSIILSLALPRRQKLRLPDFRGFIARYGLFLLFAAILLAGLTFGAVYARNADSRTLQSLDILFTTNLDARLGQSPFGIFCACFASDFLFLLSVYLLGVAAWGVPFMLLLVGFKGFGTGITAGYLCLSHALSGAGFYLLVLLPGTFLFCTALVRFSAVAFRFSKQAFFGAVSNVQPDFSPRQELIRFSSRFLTALCVTFAASLLDALLWSLFAGTFRF